MSGGEAALALARTVHFDVGLLDVNMPGNDGFETCRQLRRLRPRIAILILTVRNGEEDKVAALEFGVDDYVTKPFEIRELTARIRASIRRTQVITQENIAIRIGEIELVVVAPGVQDFYAAPVKGLRSRVLAQPSINVGKIGEADADVGMILAELGLADFQAAPKKRLRPGVIAHAKEDVSRHVDHVSRGWR